MRRTILLLVLAVSAALLAAAPPPEVGRRGMVAADHLLASQAGAAVLRAGGNAVDAAVAATLASGVVQPAGSGIGGGGFAVVVLPDGTSEVLDFREVAPAAADRDMFVRAAEGEQGDTASRIGGLAVAVPGEPAGLAMLHARHGRRSLAADSKPAMRLAAKGFSVGAHLGEALVRLGDDGSALAGALFTSVGGATVPEHGDIVRRERLAKTIAAFAKTRGRALTHGAIAADIVSAVQAAGGVMTAEDLASYEPRQREPLVGSYRGWTVSTMPPPSSGGAVLLQVLGVLEGFDLQALGWNNADFAHLFAEASQHAFADRAHFMGDPDRVDVPVERMLAPERIAEVRRSFEPGSTHEPDFYGLPVDSGTDGGTLHVSVVDGDGMAVALTTTINTSFGSRVVAGKSGVLLNNEMDDFVARPGVPNAYGLVGTEANAVAPGARPLSSMSPTVLVSPDGSRRIVLGASGGPFIISATLQVIIGMVDFGLDPSEAVAAPRFHHQWQPPLLFVDEGVSSDTVFELRKRGHKIKQMPFFSAVQVIEQGPDGTRGASDPRKGGWPAAE